MDDKRRSEPENIRRTADQGVDTRDPMTDATQTFGHDSDLSFVPFGADLSKVEIDAIEALPAGVALLVVRSGPTAGARYLLDTDVTTVGRHPEADIFFDDVTVSRRHAEFRAEDGGHRLVDLNSLNGTFVNHDRVDEILLRSGMHVQIGKYRLTYYAGPARG